MRYDLGLMDMYPIDASGSAIENDPMYKVVMKKPVDPVLLEDAVYRAIRFHPLFGTQVSYDRVYYLSTNNRPVRLIRAKDTERPKQFGKNTNGYPWQLCYWDREITIEWCHGVTDGRGALEFLKSVLSFYCGMRTPVVPRRILLGPGLEPFVDKNEKGIDYDVQPKGFPASSLPACKRGFVTDCHVLKASTEEVLACARANESTPAAALAVLLSAAIRRHLPEKAGNRNVACNVVMDLRKPLNYETMHNCCEYKRITYQDRHEAMGFHEAAKEYRRILDHARIHENMVRTVTERVELFETLQLIRPKQVRKFVYKAAAPFLKDDDCNCVLTYIGRCGFPPEVMEQVEDLQFRVWHDFGECIMACVDFGGTFRVNICENYREKGIVEDFMKISLEQGIRWENTENLLYEQGQFVEEKEKRNAPAV